MTECTVEAASAIAGRLTRPEDVLGKVDMGTNVARQGHPPWRE